MFYEIRHEREFSMSTRSKMPMVDIVATIGFVFLLVIHFPTASAGSVAHTVTAQGDAQINTAQSKFGGASGLFDGSGDYLSTPDSTDWYFVSGDFTVDFWVRFNVFPVDAYAYLVEQYQNDNNRWYLGLYRSGAAYLWMFQVIATGSTTANIQRSTTLSTNTWYHLALVRNGNNWYVFQDGVQVGATESNSAAISDLAGPLNIGANVRAPAQYFLNGWLDEFRVSKGIARWTSSFTPPTSAYTTDSSTVLLLHMDGASGSTTFTDDSLYTSASFSFNVKASATQIVVTLTYSWSGSGSLPLGSISIAGPGGTPTLQESGAVVYDRTSITVSGTNTYSIIHRATFTITAPGSVQTWTTQVSLSGISSYNVAIEVS